MYYQEQQQDVAGQEATSRQQGLGFVQLLVAALPAIASMMGNKKKSSKGPTGPTPQEIAAKAEAERARSTTTNITIGAGALILAGIIGFAIYTSKKHR